MYGFMKFLFGTLAALVLLVPVGLLLLVVGIPVLIVVGLLAVPVVLALALLGLPILIVGVVLSVLVALLFGLAVAALKVAFFVVLPVLLVVWLVKRMRAGRAEAYEWA